MNANLNAEYVSDPLVRHVSDWLIAQALEDSDVETIVLGCSERLQAAGIPLARTFVVLPTLHPLHRAVGITWQWSEGTKVEGYPHVPGGVSEQYRQSPHFFMRERDLDLMRVRLDAKRQQFRFPVLEDLRAAGMTDYLAFVVDIAEPNVGPAQGLLGSFACDRPGGFTPQEVSALMHLRGRLAVAIKSAFKSELMENIAETYLGPKTGANVLSGQIQRGDGEAVEAVIWYSDLRDSTALADTLSSQEYIDTLNAYYDVTGGAVLEAGGEILSFVGDGLLAVFQPAADTETARRDAADAAVTAAKNARRRLAALNAERALRDQAALHYGTALHCGNVHYGNVGVPNRLTFSVFGAAVNEAQRIEQLTKKLAAPVLLSDRFVEIGASHACPLGAHKLAGVARKINVHGLKVLGETGDLGADACQEVLPVKKSRTRSRPTAQKEQAAVAPLA